MLQEIRFGARALLRDKTTSLAIIVIFALGIGVTTAVYAVVDTVLIRDLPFPNANELAWVWGVTEDSGQAVFSLPEFIDYRDQNRMFGELAAFAGVSMSVIGSGDAERIQGARSSANLFELLGVRAGIGRTLKHSDDRPDAPRVAVLSHSFWLRRFSRDPAAIGKTLTMNGTAYEIVGVLQPEFPELLTGLEVFVPLSPGTDPWRTQRNSVNFLRILGRMKSGVTLRQAQDDLNSVFVRMREQFPREYANDSGVRIVALHERFAGTHRRSLTILLLSVVGLLLIACANLASLMSARSLRRSREVAVRTALGATRSQIVRQCAAEVVLPVIIGGIFGALLSVWCVQLLIALTPGGFPRVAEIEINVRVLAFCFLATLTVSILCALAPALSAARNSVIDGIRTASIGTASRSRLRAVLVVGQLALAVVLLAVSNTLMMSLSELQRVEPGYAMNGILTARLALPAPGYPDRASTTRFYEELSAKLREIPGVQSVGSTSILPMSAPVATANFNVPGIGIPRDKRPVSTFRMISPQYLETMGIQVLRGRAFDDGDSAQSRPVALINRTLAEKFFPQEDPVGREILVEDNPGGERSLEIAGVIADVKHYRLEDGPTFDIYIAQRQVHPAAVVWLRNNQFWVLKTAGDPTAFSDRVRQEVRALDPSVPAASIQTMETYLATSLASRRFIMQLLAAFSAAAMALALTGVYAAMSYWVAERTRDIGIRMSLGADARMIVVRILGRGIGMGLFAIAIGIPLGLIATHAIRSMLFGVNPGSLFSTLQTIMVVLIAAGSAAFVPALRALRVDPIAVLRPDR